MKICFINNLYFPYELGGAEKSVKLLAESLTKNNFNCIVITITEGRDKIDYINDVKIYYINHRNIYYIFRYNVRHSSFSRLLWNTIDVFNLRMYIKIKKIIKFENPDIVHTHNLQGFSVAPWIASHKLKIKIVHTLRDYHLICCQSKMFKKEKNCRTQCLTCSIFTKAKKKYSKNIDAVVGISSYILNKHTFFNYFPLSKKKIIYNSVIIDEKKIRIKDLELKTLSVGFLGTVEKSKGIEKLLESIYNSKYCKEIKIFVGGKGVPEYVEYLRNEYNYLNLTFLGYVNPSDFFKIIDVLVVPSQWEEPFGRVVIESYSRGIPVIVSNKGGLPEIVENGKTGFIIKGDEISELSDIIELYLNDRTLFVTQRKYIKVYLKKFDEANIIKKYITIYNDLL